MAKTESTSSLKSLNREGRARVHPHPSRATSPRLWIAVTQDIIDTAVPKDSQHCMVADAVKATFPEAKSIVVDLQTIRFSDPARGLRYVYLTPRIAQEALIEFDEGRIVPPFECRLHRAVQIVSMYHRAPDGKHVKTRNLGRKHVQLEDGGRGTPTVVGGRTPPVICDRPEGLEKDTKLACRAADIVEQGRRLRGRPRRRRDFGMRAFKIGSLLTGGA